MALSWAPRTVVWETEREISSGSRPRLAYPPTSEDGLGTKGLSRSLRDQDSIDHVGGQVAPALRWLDAEFP